MRRGLTVLAAAALVLCYAGPAGAAAWAVQATPNPSGFNTLAGVSCPSTTSCTAVGGSDSGGTIVTLAESWNGSTWAIQPTPNPAGSTGPGIGLQAVSCVSAASCMAVGEYYASDGDILTLAESWDGSSWAIQPAPNPAGAPESYLNGVSCASATSCEAVGNYHPASSGRSVTLAEHWDGSTWTIQATRNPSGSAANVLQAVSCASAASCTAVGHGGSTRDSSVLAEHWNGTRWALQVTPAPAGSSSAGFFGVSCHGSQCTAAGFSSGAGAQVPLAEHWSGGAWAIQAVPVSSGATDAVFYGISCYQATKCSAAGEYVAATGDTDTLAESWNGSSWLIQVTSNPSTSSVPSNALGGISCPTASTCTAVGEYIDSSEDFLTLAERN